MKMLIDFLPVALFFIVYKAEDIYVATAVLIIASAIQTVGYRLWKGKFEQSHVITLILVAAFGGLTLMLHDEMFIKWKPSVINWLFGAVFIGSMWIGDKPIIQRMLGGQVNLPTEVWSKLNIAWASFFIVLGFINLYVVYNFDTDTWVNFKLFGMLGLTLAFIVAQSLYMAKFMQDEKKQADE
ncbi:MAG: septation protein A [Zetaproteobacteria bacterium CG2_30_46_52]|nr:MAG: septation protein A [Zetaproteobacteria bacterium CG2_30_46_52]